MSDELLGDDFNLYWDTANNYDTPTWARQISVGSLGFDPGNEQVEIPKRIAFKTYKKGRADWTLSFTMNYDPTNTFHVAVRDSISNGTKIHLAIVDGEMTDDPDGWHAWWFLSGPLDASLDTNANFEVEGKIHHDTGAGDAELPALINEGT